MIINDLRLAIRLARNLQLKLRQGNEPTEEMVKLLGIIKNLDLKQQYSLEKKEFPPVLVRKCKLIYALATRALREIEERNYVPNNLIAILEQIISLEEEISVEVILPTRNIRKMLQYSPIEAARHGILFRGVSDEDYEKIQKGEPLFAPNPRGTLTITEHILDQVKAYNSPFISLTTDVKTAERFGKVIAIKKELLHGHLYTPSEIEADLKKRASAIVWTAPLRLQRKNSEFLLGSSKTEFACIMPEVVLNVKPLAA